MQKYLERREKFLFAVCFDEHGELLRQEKAATVIQRFWRTKCSDFYVPKDFNKYFFEQPLRGEYYGVDFDEFYPGGWMELVRSETAKDQFLLERGTCHSLFCLKGRGIWKFELLNPEKQGRQSLPFYPKKKQTFGEIYFELAFVLFANGRVIVKVYGDEVGTVNSRFCNLKSIEKFREEEHSFFYGALSYNCDKMSFHCLTEDTKNKSTLLK
ncbi:hypothetical protein GMAR_ORF33 [Golden Marseillevirus]|uniref:hypothetical protein n=1 Tax=Golden Marseillevirus TaxID=1720526 RepID=UPI000877AAD5|nr:hypothetical protein GMAR_ORF33 [Golden Marseillevirus]ALX27408.1 hypothetical protein GMAR_ORF33 [Golden Marseillevirus]